MKSIYNALFDLEKEGKIGVLCTIIGSGGSTPRNIGSKMLVYPDGEIIGSIGGGEMESRVISEATKSLSDMQARILEYRMVDPKRGDPGICGGQVKIFIEPIAPKPNMLIIGAGHVGKAVAHLAHWLGFKIIVNDDRPEFCNAETIPEGDQFFPVPMGELSDLVKITPWTYIVLTTRGVDVDIQGLPSLLDSSAAYIGVIGSNRRWKETSKQLRDLSISLEKLSWVKSPIGLELNAETPQEIAVSIMAEIIMLRNGGDGKPMSKQ